MNINRHNYEEYFILYQDNELDADQRRAVEEFVQNNPDLKDELDAFSQYKLEPDPSIQYQGKEELLRPPVIKGSINLSNYEESLVLYLDNELTDEQVIEMKALIDRHEVVKKEWETIQKIKLQPELVSFGDKSTLYRKEENVRRLAPYWRIAAAVILFLLAGTVTVIVINNRKSV